MADATLFQTSIVNDITAAFPMNKLHRGAAPVKENTSPLLELNDR
jgi:hypothetical protein